MKHKCDRCGEESSAFKMSKLNTDTLCMKCIERERTHPRYQEAVEAERQAVLNGDYNYAGLLHGQPIVLNEPDSPTCGDCANFDRYENENDGYGGCNSGKHGTVHEANSAVGCSDYQ